MGADSCALKTGLNWKYLVERWFILYQYIVSLAQIKNNSTNHVICLRNCHTKLSHQTVTCTIMSERNQINNNTYN